MLKSVSSILKISVMRALIPALALLAAFFSARPASAQTFTLGMSGFTPFAVVPGQSSNANISVGGSGVTVDLSCTVAPQRQQTVPVLPTCTVSPTSRPAPGSATLTVNTEVNGQAATQGNYVVTVTGTAGATTQSVNGTLPVISVAPQFTLTVTTGLVPSSVHAGSGGQATISANPLYGYTGTISLSCASVTPLVAYPPVCSFSYPNNPSNNGILIPGNQPYSATLTISTVGPNTPVASHAHGRSYYALWLPVPMLALAGIGIAGGKRSRRAWGALSCFVLAGSLLLIPACGNSNTTTITKSSTTITPNDSYSFTLTGVDTLGGTASNISTPPIVTLIVD